MVETPCNRLLYNNASHRIASHYEFFIISFHVISFYIIQFYTKSYFIISRHVVAYPSSVMVPKRRAVRDLLNTAYLGREERGREVRYAGREKEK